MAGLATTCTSLIDDLYQPPEDLGQTDIHRQETQTILMVALYGDDLSGELCCYGVRCLGGI